MKFISPITREEYDLNVVKRLYSNKRIRLDLHDKEGFPYAVATINDPDVMIPVNHAIIKDYSENQGVLLFLMDNKVVSKPVSWIKSGFVTAPICEVLI